MVAMRERDGTLYKGEEGWEPIIRMDEWLAVKAILEDPARLTHDRGGRPRHAPPVESLITEAIFAAVEYDRFARLILQP
jgi:hypothetical protein